MENWGEHTHRIWKDLTFRPFWLGEGLQSHCFHRFRNFTFSYKYSSTYKYSTTLPSTQSTLWSAQALTPLLFLWSTKCCVHLSSFTMKYLRIHWIWLEKKFKIVSETLPTVQWKEHIIWFGCELSVTVSHIRALLEITINISRKFYTHATSAASAAATEIMVIYNFPF